MRKIKKKSKGKHLIKERFIQDLITLFDQLSNTPETHKKNEIMSDYLSRYTTYHKRLLSLYLEHLLDAGKYLWFFQPYVERGQSKGIRISLLDLKVATQYKVYGQELFHKLEKYVEQLPESVYRYVTSLFAKVNITGLSLYQLRVFYNHFELDKYKTELDDLDLVNFSIKEDNKEKYLGKVQLFDMNKFPLILASVEGEILYYFKRKDSIVSNITDVKLRAKLVMSFDSEIYMLGTYIEGMFNLIYLSTKPLHLIRGEVKGLGLDEFKFEQEHLDRLSLCMDYKFLEFRVLRNTKEVLSFCYKYKSTILFLQSCSYYNYSPLKLIRKVKYSNMTEGGICLFKDYHNQGKVFEVAYKDVFDKEIEIDNVDILDLVCENTYYLLFRDFGKVYVFASNNINNSKIGAKRLIKITNKNKFKVFE